ncbi:Hypp7494 [Branchiostoma lanceolatum]|uniref:Hypp7494 protein n=1 Tax=Branchiostoma lanceolatum TaxID=7740 RepID=A0A8K0EC09_BRALA|nr:Hypp7494 [Branchiostoma lanceolatum]
MLQLYCPAFDVFSGRIGIFEALVLRTILRVLSPGPQAPVPVGSPHSRPDPTVFPTLSPYRGYFCGGAIAVGPSARGDTAEPARHGMKFAGAAPCQSQSTYAGSAGVNEACFGASLSARGTDRSSYRAPPFRGIIVKGF